MRGAASLAVRCAPEGQPMRWDDFRSSDYVEDRRGGGGGMGIPMGRGGLGLGTIIVLTLAGWALGIKPAILIGGAGALPRAIWRGGAEMTAPARQPTQQTSQQAPQGRAGAPPEDRAGQFAS